MANLYNLSGGKPMIDRLRRNWWFILGITLALVAIALALFYSPTRAQTPTPTIPPLSLGQPLYLELGTVYTVTSNSMAPSINAGDMVMLTPQKTAPRIGQVVVFWDIIPQNIFAHRVIAVGIDSKGWWATTKGDAISGVDWQPLREANLLGVVKWRIQVLN